MVSESQSSPEKTRWDSREKSLVEIKEEREEVGIPLCKKIVEYTHLPVSWEALYESIQEIFSSKSFTLPKEDTIGQIKDPNSDNKKIISWSSDQLMDILQTKTSWHAIVEEFKQDPNMPLEDLDKVLKALNGLSVFQIVMDILKFWAQKEETLQKIQALEAYHMPKTAALWANIMIQVGQEYGEDILEREKLNHYIYSGKIEKVYNRLLKPGDFRLKVERREFRKEVQGAKQKAIDIVAQSEPAMDAELAARGIGEAARRKIYGRAVVFLSENPLGQKVASMVEITANSPVGKSVGSLMSGMREWFISPLCASMLACSIMDAPDKEKAIIQYFTFLFAGQIAQEWAKPVGNLLLKFLEKMAPKWDTEIAKIGKWLMSDMPKSKFVVLCASIAVVCGVFEIPWIAKPISEFANWLDQNINHGKWREATGNAVELVSIAASWELVLGWNVFREISGFNGVNPFKDQLDFLALHPGKEGIESWNKRVGKVQRWWIADILSKWNGPTQMAILEQQKITSPESWARQNIIHFQNKLGEFEMTNASLLATLQNIPWSPGSPSKLLWPKEELRYLEYALAETDIWNTRDHLAKDEPNILSNGRTTFNRLAGANTKAIIWLWDMKGSIEDRLDNYFKVLDTLIAAEKQKISRMKNPGMGYMGGGYSPPQYELDSEAYKKIEPWIEQVQNAKKQWMTMRAGALDVAKQVMVARSLGVYDQKKWLDPLIHEDGSTDRESLVFQGHMDKIAREYKLHELTTATDAVKANNILDAVGSDVRLYGDDILDDQKRGERDDEYKKWMERNAFGIDDRLVHFDRVKNLIREAFHAWIAPEFMARILEPISDMARNQGEGKYVTPDVVHNIETQIGRHLLDRAFEDDVTRSTSPSDIREVHYKCPGYEFTRTITVKKGTIETKLPTPDMILEQDFMKTISSQATFGWSIRSMTSERALWEPEIFTRGLYERKVKKIQNKAELRRKDEALRQEQNRLVERTRALQRKEQENHKSDNEKTFRDYYSNKGWDKISPDKALPVIYAKKQSQKEEMSAIPKDDVWWWEKPHIYDQVIVATYWGPKDSAEATIAGIDDFRHAGWNDRMYNSMRELLISGNLENPLQSLIMLANRSVYYEKSLMIRSYATELLKTLAPAFEKTSDKRGFLTRSLDTLLKYPGISGDTSGKILAEIIQ